MNAPLEMPTQPLVLREDAGGIATLTLNRAAAVQRDQRRAARRAAGRARRRCRRCIGAGRRDRRRRPRILPRPRPEGDARQLERGVHRRPLPPLLQRDADDRAAPAAGDRQGPRHRHGRRLPARRRLRPRRRRRRRALRDLRHQFRPVLRDARRAGLAQHLAQAGVRNADDRRVHRCADRARAGASSTASRAADRLDAETLALAQALLAKPRAVVAAGKRFFYAQLERTTEAAYAMASDAITRNMLGPDAQEGVTRVRRKAQAALERLTRSDAAAPAGLLPRRARLSARRQHCILYKSCASPVAALHQCNRLT